MSMSRRSFLNLACTAAGAIALSNLSVPAAAAATPYRILRRFEVVRGLAGSSRKLVAAPRAGGGFIALWEQSPDGNSNFSYYRHYDNAGRPIGRNVRISIDTRGTERIGSIVTHPDGTSNVFTFGRMPKDAAGNLWWMQRVGAGAAKLGPRVRIATGNRGASHLAARLADGRIVCAWRNDDLLGNLAKVVTPKGDVLAATPETQFGMFHNWVEGVAALPKSAGAAFAYYSAPGEVAFQVVAADLQKVGDPLIFPASVNYRGVAVAAHPKGFVAMWTAADINAVDNPHLDGAVFSPSGEILVRFKPVVLKPGLDMNKNFNLRPALLTLPGGRVLLARNKLAVDSTGRDLFLIVLHLFGPDGKPAAKPTIVFRDRARIGELFTRVNNPRSMTRLRNGSILLTYDKGPFGSPRAEALNFKVVQ